MTRRIGIVTLQDDLHAIAVAHELRHKFAAVAELIEVDRLHQDYELAWRSDALASVWLRSSSGGRRMDLSSFDVIWWRRSRSEQQFDFDYEDVQRDLINNDCRSSLRGALTTTHAGVWLSHPDATERAANKLVQLRTAANCGLRIPKTLVSNCPDEVRRFLEECGGSVIAKPVLGTKHTLLFTKQIEKQRLNDASIRACPTIYQELIPGKEHLRVNCFGDNLVAALIESERLDWRVTLDMPFSAFDLDRSTAALVRRTLRELGLGMGVVDLKLTQSGEPVWFEVNPQGQFLFVEGLTKQPVLNQFARFLVESAEKRLL